MKLNKEKCDQAMLNSFNNYTSIAKETGLTYAAVHKILTGKANPRPSSLKAVCEVLKCSPNDLI